VTYDIEPDVRNWSPAWSQQLTDHPTALCWHENGRRLAAASLGGEAVTLDAKDGSLLGQPIWHEGGALCVGWRRGELITGGQDGQVTVGGERLGFDGWINDLAVSADGQIAIAHGRHVSIAGAGRIGSRSTTVTSVAWHPSELRVAAGSFASVTWISAADGSSTDVELAWGGAVAALRIAEDSGWAAAGIRGDWSYLWRLDSNDSVLALPVGTSTGHHVGFSADGSQLASATPKMSAVFDLESPDPLGQPAGQWLSSVGAPTALAWHPMTDLLVTAVSIGTGGRDNGLLAWRPRRASIPIGFVTTPRPVSHLAWAPDGRTLAIATVDGTISIEANPFDVD